MSGHADPSVAYRTLAHRRASFGRRGPAFSSPHPEALLMKAPKDTRATCPARGVQFSRSDPPTAVDRGPTKKPRGSPREDELPLWQGHRAQLAEFARKCACRKRPAVNRVVLYPESTM